MTGARIYPPSNFDSLKTLALHSRHGSEAPDETSYSIMSDLAGNRAEKAFRCCVIYPQHINQCSRNKVYVTLHSSTLSLGLVFERPV